jgi:hypothetical protein
MKSHNLDPGNSTYEELVANQEYDRIEKIFWQNVENSESKRIKVEYAADLPNNKFGRKFGKDEEWYKNHPWNLNKMHLMKNSLLQF